MNILINYVGRNGAGPQYAFEMAKGFLENGAKVYVIISSGITNLSQWENLGVEKICVLDTYSTKLQFIISTIRLTLKDKTKIKRYFSDIHFDCIYVPMQTYWSFMISMCFPNVPVYFTLHDPECHSGESLFNRLFYHVTKYELLSAKKTIVLSKKFQQYVAKTFNKNLEDIMVLPHGAFWSYRQSNCDDCIINYEANKINFLFFGRIEDYKGLDLLLEAYCNVEQRYFGCVSLVIAGKGDIEKYKSLITKIKNIHVLNYMIPDNCIKSLFSGANIVTVLPYKDATQSGVIPTAQMFESLIIASDTGGMREQLQDGSLGILFPPNDVVALEDCMLKIVKNYSSYKVYIRRGWKYINSLSWCNSAKKVMDDMGL